MKAIDMECLMNTEEVAVMIHKQNVYCKVHGWRSKYFHDTFKRELNHRVKDKVMFGSDYPFFLC